MALYSATLSSAVAAGASVLYVVDLLLQRYYTYQRSKAKAEKRKAEAAAAEKEKQSS